MERSTQREGKRRAAGAGFTLIEMLLAVAILVVITVTVYQFVDVTLRTSGASLREGEQAMQLSGFRRLLTAQLSALPTGQHASLIGMNIKNKGGGGGRRDAMQMICPAGNALLTPDAKGLYQVTLDLRENPRDRGHLSLGLEREPWTDDDDDDDDDDLPNKAPGQKAGATHAKLPSDWVMLMDNVQSLEIAYFDARLNGWVDKWTDSSLLPNLVRVRVVPQGTSVPYEIVERVPGGGIAKAALPAGVQAILQSGGRIQTNPGGNGQFGGGNTQVPGGGRLPLVPRN